MLYLHCYTELQDSHKRNTKNIKQRYIQIKIYYIIVYNTLGIYNFIVIEHCIQILPILILFLFK